MENTDTPKSLNGNSPLKRGRSLDSSKIKIFDCRQELKPDKKVLEIGSAQEPKHPPKVLDKFVELGLNEKILKVIRDFGFNEPSAIQKKTIPLILDGKDVVGQSATGSGKTLAFSSGIIEKIQKGDGVQTLILTPTRELCGQVAKAFKSFSKYYDINVAEIYGGVSIGPQIHSLRKVEVVVGTPGRILDHLERRTLDLSRVKFLILDEADRMLDMGFIDDVRKIIEICPKKRQTLLFSATISPDIEYIGNKYMDDPAYIEVESNVDPSKLKQIFYDVPSQLKFSLLVHLLNQEKSNLIMVFCNTRRNVDLIAKNLKRYKLHAIAIHGGLAQNKRTKIMQEFHAGDTLILVCTDVAARGLDIKGVSHVYNYDSSKNRIDYIHRIGRTARAGKEGIAISIVSQKDFANFRNICKEHPDEVKRVEMPRIEQLNVKFNEDYSEGGGRSYNGRRPRLGRGGGGGPRRNYGNGSSSGRSFRRNSSSSSGGRSYGNRDDARKQSFGRRDRANRGRSSGGSGGGYSRGGSRGSSGGRSRDSRSSGGFRKRS